MPSIPSTSDPAADVLEHIHDGVFVLDEASRVVFINHAGEKLLDRDRATLLGKNLWEAFPHAIGGRSHREYERALVEQRAVEFDDFLVRLGRWFEVRVSPVAGRLAVSFRDITERRAMNERLRRSEARFLSLMKATRQAVWVTGPDGRVGEDIPEWRAFTGFSVEQTVGMGWLDAIHPDDRAATASSWRHAVTHVIVFEVEQRLRRHDGVYRRMSVRGVPIRGADDAVIEWVGTSTDVTEQRDLELKLVKAEKLESLGALAGGIAHDVNNLLVGILGNASVALTDAPAALVEPLTEIVTTAQRAGELAHQLLAFSGKGRFAMAPLDLSSMLHDAQTQLQTAMARRASLCLEAPADIPSIEADGAQIRQVVVNLVANASDALDPAGGTVTVRSGVVHATSAQLRSTFVDDRLPEGAYVFIEVSDTGKGMEPETAARMFDPFFTTKRSGHGLGLAATLGIVRGHHGAIRVETEPGKGSRITALFPALSAPAAPAPALPTESSPAPGGMVLVVDDDDLVRRVAKRILVKAGYTVIEAEHGKAALAIFAKSRGEIALVLLDLNMPVMGGEETFRALRALDPALPIVLSSGYNEHDATSHFVGRGLAGFVQKPFVMSDFLEVVRRTMKG